MATPHLTLFHHPHSRSAGVRILLEELGMEADLQLVDLKQAERPAALLAANPQGKIPTLLADGVAVSEQAAIYQFLAELKPEAGLSPAVGDPLRGPYLRALAFYGNCFEPALVDKMLKRAPAPRSTCPYGDVAMVEQQVRDQLKLGPWWLGERFTAADVLWGAALGWITRFGMLEATPEIAAYLARFDARPAVQRARALDQALLAP